MRKPITSISLIPINGIYHPTKPISEDMAKMLSRYDRQVSTEPATEADIQAYRKKVIQRTEKALSEYYSNNLNEFERL